MKYHLFGHICKVLSDFKICLVFQIDPDTIRNTTENRRWNFGKSVNAANPLLFPNLCEVSVNFNTSCVKVSKTDPVDTTDALHRMPY